MKKIILIITAVALIINFSNAQENNTDSRDQMHLGIKIGANLSNVYDAQGQEFNADPKFGFVAGGFIAIPIGKYLGVQPEVLFSQKGFQATGTILGSSYNFTRTTNYIDVPLLVQLKPSEFITLMAGPQFSYLIKQTDVFVNSIYSEVQQQEFKNDNLRRNILCFLGGVDLNYNHLVIGLRAGWDVQNNNGDGTSDTPRYKNVWYQATIGCRF